MGDEHLGRLAGAWLREVTPPPRDPRGSVTRAMTNARRTPQLRPSRLPRFLSDDHVPLVPLDPADADSQNGHAPIVVTRRRGGPRPMTLITATTLGAATVLVGALLWQGGDGDTTPAVTGPAGPTLAATSPSAAPVPSGEPAVVEAATVHPLEVERLATWPGDEDPSELAKDRSGGAHYIDRASGTVRRVDLDTGEVVDVVHAGDEVAGGESIGRPTQLESSADTVVIIDDQGRPFGLSTTLSTGSWWLRMLDIEGGASFGADHGDVEVWDLPAGGWRMYVVEPSLGQIMRYQQTFDRRAFEPPSAYLATASEEVADIEQLYVDLDAYALFEDDTLRRYGYGGWDGEFTLGELPDATVSDYRFVDGSGSALSLGRAYLYDAANERIVGFSKADGSYLGQWVAPGDGAALEDVRGMYVIGGGLNAKGTVRRDDRLVWLTPSGIYRATLATGGD